MSALRRSAVAFAVAVSSCSVCGDALGLARASQGAHGDCAEIATQRQLVERAADVLEASGLRRLAHRVRAADDEVMADLLGQIQARVAVILATGERDAVERARVLHQPLADALKAFGGVR